jgi:hypothetical protein
MIDAEGMAMELGSMAEESAAAAGSAEGSDLAATPAAPGAG